MKVTNQFLGILFCCAFTTTIPKPAVSFTSHKTIKTMYDTLRIESRLSGIKLGLLHSEPASTSQYEPVLFIHGASFPSSLAAGFRMNDYSWMDHLNEEGYETFALDFIGYGNSDRYPEMQKNTPAGQPLGRAYEIVEDIDRAINYILRFRNISQVSIIAHSWGGTVAALYATQHPEKIKSLILFATPVASASQSEVKVDTTLERYEVMTAENRVKAMIDLTPQGQTCPLESELFSTWKQDWIASDPLSRNGEVTFPSGWKADLLDLQHGKTYLDPSKVTVPTLLIRGEWDEFPTNEDAGRMFRALTNASHKKYVVIERSTHVMHLEKNRVQLYKEVSSFLRSGQRATPVAVIFEVFPSDAGKKEYLDLAAHLKKELVKIDGFISIERYQSLSDPEKLLSLSFWRDEEAVKQWRNTEVHRMAQSKGRQGIFRDYRLRVVNVIRDYGMYQRREAPADSKAIHDRKRK
jgi:pimeloyl-ACP methyl ester carboxylesterase/heme-degrading monooxygenase HmoA